MDLITDFLRCVILKLWYDREIKTTELLGKPDDALNAVEIPPSLFGQT
jgi:hypothetical protein